MLSPCLFNLHAEYIMRSAGLDEAQAGIKIARRNINIARNEAIGDSQRMVIEPQKNILFVLKRFVATYPNLTLQSSSDETDEGHKAYDKGCRVDGEEKDEEPFPLR